MMTRRDRLRVGQCRASWYGKGLVGHGGSDVIGKQMATHLEGCRVPAVSTLPLGISSAERVTGTAPKQILLLVLLHAAGAPMH